MEIRRFPLLFRFNNWKFIRKSTIGYILIITAAGLAGLLEVAGKPLVDASEIEDEINPIVLALATFIVIALFFTPIAKKSKSKFKLGKKDLTLICLIGVAEVSAITTNFFGLMETTAVNSSIIGNTEIIFAVIIAIAIFKEKLEKNEFIPFLMIIFGAMLFPLWMEFSENGFQMSKLVFGDILIMIGAFFYACDMNISKFVNCKISAAKISQISAVAGGLFAITLIFLFEIPIDMKIHQIPNILFMGIFASGLSSFFFVISLRMIGAVRTILLYSTTTMFGVVFAGIFLAEEITIFNIISIGIAGIGIFMLRR